MKAQYPPDAETQEVITEYPNNQERQGTVWVQIVLNHTEVLSRWTAMASVPSLNKIWDNPEEDAAWANM